MFDITFKCLCTCFITFDILFFIQSAQEGAQTTIYASAADECDSNVSGSYFSDCAEFPSSLLSYNVDLQARVWALSVKQCGLN